MSRNPQRAHPAIGGLSRAFGVVVSTAQFALVGGAVVILLGLAAPIARKAVQPHAAPLPPTMEEVDWHAPDSSQYCLACHKQVGLAIGGSEVERGHSQNVQLALQQREAIADMHTVAGQDNTLICMSCHQLDRDPANPHMLADTLSDSRLCQRCHAGHYARGTRHDLRLSAPAETNLQGQTVAETGPCSACHLAHSFAKQIQRSPLDPEGYCIPCHSEYHAAAKHARTRMDHPESRCRECHDPHDADFGAFLKTSIQSLCVTCHTDYGRGPPAGMHPVGTMDEPLPAQLVESGAPLMDHPRELTCVVCHDTHEAEYSGLLRVSQKENRLCLLCHEDRLREKGGGMPSKHGQRPVLDEKQLQVVAGWNGRVGENGELLCISCHDVHRSGTNPMLLRFSVRYGETCVACHPEREIVAGSAHDMRIRFPSTPNAAGLTPASAGVCSPCHMAHEFPRTRKPAEGDPNGHCVTCHQPGECGQTALAGGMAHPGTKCADCHDPHQRRYPKFLVAPPAELCTRCHESQGRVSGGRHDPRHNPAAWPKEALAAGGPCLSCHVPHGGGRSGLLRFDPPAGFDDHDGACVACHQGASWGAKSATAAIHPRRMDAEHANLNPALAPTGSDGEERIGCHTCHDPHRGAESPHLTRVGPGEPTEQLCLACHNEKRLIRSTGHSTTSLVKTGYSTDFCRPCHAMHDSPENVWGELLSPRFLRAECALPEDELTRCVPCQACHRAEGSAPKRKFTEHPEVLAMNLVAPGEPGYLPLYAPDGKVDPRGQVTCRTCHLSHGRLDLLRILEADDALEAEQSNALNAQVRPFVMPNVCTSCHGAEARGLFLYFHEPDRRPVDFHSPTVGKHG